MAGVDEAGRGPLAGPVVAAAVVLNPDNPIEGLNDSKKLSDKSRRKLFVEIQNKASAYAIAQASVSEIETFNIHHATLLAMQRAVLALSANHPVNYVIVDGIFCPVLDVLKCPCEAIVGGDLSQPAISAASILAKVFRDDEMIRLDTLYPGYGLAKHKGYSTKEHIEALVRLGVSDIHRRSYEPVRALLSQSN